MYFKGPMSINKRSVCLSSPLNHTPGSHLLQRSGQSMARVASDQ